MRPVMRARKPWSGASGASSLDCGTSSGYSRGWSYVSSSVSSCRSLSSSSSSCWRSLQIQAAKPAVAMVTVTTKGSQYPNADLPGRACLRRAASYRSIAFRFTSRIPLSHERVEVASKRYTPTPRFLAWSKCGRLRFSREILFAMRHISP